MAIEIQPVLIIEGDQSLRDVYKTALTVVPTPFRPIVTESGTEALEYFQQNRINTHIIVMGGDFQDMTAESLTERFRQISQNPDDPCILWFIGEGYARLEDPNFLRRKGANEIIYERSLGPRELIAKLNEINERFKV